MSAYRPEVVKVVWGQGPKDGGVMLEDVVKADGAVGEQPGENEGREEEAAQHKRAGVVASWWQGLGGTECR